MAAKDIFSELEAIMGDSVCDEAGTDPKVEVVLENGQSVPSSLNEQIAVMFDLCERAIGALDNWNTAMQDMRGAFEALRDAVSEQYVDEEVDSEPEDADGFANQTADPDENDLAEEETESVEQLRASDASATARDPSVDDGLGSEAANALERVIDELHGRNLTPEAEEEEDNEEVRT